MPPNQDLSGEQVAQEPAESSSKSSELSGVNPSGEQSSGEQSSGEKPLEGQPSHAEPSLTSATTGDIPAFGWSAYAERVNGRFAMVGLAAVLFIEALSRDSFLHWAGLVP